MATCSETFGRACGAPVLSLEVAHIGRVRQQGRSGQRQTWLAVTGPELEHRHGLHQLLCLTLQVAGGSCHFFRRCGVLLGGLVDLCNGLANLADALVTENRLNPTLRHDRPVTLLKSPSAEKNGVLS